MLGNSQNSAIYANAFMVSNPSGVFNTAWQLLLVPDKGSHPVPTMDILILFNDSLSFKSFHVIEAQILILTPSRLFLLLPMLLTLQSLFI